MDISNETTPTMNLFRKFIMVAIFALGFFGIQYHMISTWKKQRYEYFQQLDVVSAALSKLKLDPSLTGSIKPEILRAIAIDITQQLFQNIPKCIDQQQQQQQVPATNVPPLPKLYIITPTYRRPEQLPEMTRLSQTLLHVKNIKWLVIEDAKTPTKELNELLKRSGIDYEHLIAPMPEKYKTKKGSKPRGVSNRNRGLTWIRANASDGVIYFADDDNTYDIRIFEQMRYTKKVSMWPVGLLTKFGLSTPVVTNGKLVKFYDGWIAGRKFPVDMAEFAINVQFLLKRPNATMPYKPGYEEDGFLRSLAPFEPKEIELLANNCTEILVWHTQAKKNPIAAAINQTIWKNTNLIELKKQLVL